MMDYKGCKCASCHKVLKEGDDIVICPECGAPYHRECYAAEGRCVFSAKHGKGFEYVPPEAKPDVNANGPICPVCHAQNPPDTRFCERCGQPMRGGVPPQAAQSSPQYAEPGMSGTGMPGGFGGPGAQYATGDVMTQLHLAKEYDGISTQDWMKYIGNSAPYYLYQFQRMDESGRKTSFCWSALFIPEFYFFYRKMWGWGALALAVSLIVSIPSLLSLMAALGIATALPLSASALSTLITVCGLLNWGVRIASCLFGFYLFRQSAARRMRAMKDDSTDDDRYRTELERRGGPSRVAVVLVGVLLLVCSFAFSAWIGPDRLMSAFYLY